MGVPLRGGRFEQGLDTVRRLLAGEEVAGARIAPVTPEQPIEVWIGGTAEPAIRRAASPRRRLARQRRRRPGRGAGAGCDLPRALRRTRSYAHRRGDSPRIHVGASAEDADRPRGRSWRGGYDRRCIVCTAAVEQVADRFRALAEMGFTDVIVRQLASEQPDAGRVDRTARRRRCGVGRRRLAQLLAQDLAERGCGGSSLTQLCRGRLNGASSPAAYSSDASASSPPSVTTTAVTTSPHSSDGVPIDGHVGDTRNSRNTSSTSRGYTLYPPEISAPCCGRRC